MSINAIVKICRIHGNLTKKDTYKNFHKKNNKYYLKCKFCHIKLELKYYKKNFAKKMAYRKEYGLKHKDRLFLLRKKWENKNKEKIKENSKKYYKENSESFKNNRLLREFGISLNDYKKMYDKQNGLCLICNKKRSLVIDHCHLSEKKGIIKIRGLLCRGCNVGIGNLQDSIELLQSAITYLRKHECT